MQQLAPGTRLNYTNDTSKAIDLVLQSSALSMRTRLAIGQSIQFDVGNAPATLYTLEPEEPESVLELVRIRPAAPPPPGRA